MTTSRVLFLCTHNSARSQMAEGVLRHLATDRFDVASAGTESRGVNPIATRAMAEIGIDLSEHTSKTLDRCLGQPWDYVITVCDSANEACPVFPAKPARLRRSVDCARQRGRAARGVSAGARRDRRPDHGVDRGSRSDRVIDLRQDLLQRLVAEGLGTAFLLAAVVGSGIMGERLAGGNVAVALLANTLATGAALVALILTFGPIAGAHFNPAVTLADASQDGWRGRTLLPTSPLSLLGHSPVLRPRI